MNRRDWLQEMDYSIAEALNRLDDDWITQLNVVARGLSDPKTYYSKYEAWLRNPEQNALPGHADTGEKYFLN